MADYYPLLAKAVSGLKQSTPEARLAIYERARNALLGQLRNMQPPAPESAIQRESAALDDAVARLEAEWRKGASSPAPDAAPPPPPPPPPPPQEPRRDEREVEEPSARETLRPAAPKPTYKQSGGMRRLAIIVGALAAVTLLVAVAAIKLRDRPEDLAKLTPTPEAQDQKSAGKIGERVGADTGHPAAGAPNAAGQTLPIAYRAGLLIQAPSEPGGVKTYNGTALWRRDVVNRGPNQQLTSVIKVDIDLPDAKMKLSLTMEKNFDTSLSFSHTITLRFQPGEDSRIGNVTAVNVPEMRRDEAPKGVPLVGLQVDIAPNVFLVGLASTAEAQNIEALKGPNWIDIPMSLSNSRIAKITFEKGAGGDRIMNEVLAEWKAQ